MHFIMERFRNRDARPLKGEARAVAIHQRPPESLNMFSMSPTTMMTTIMAARPAANAPRIFSTLPPDCHQYSAFFFYFVNLPYVP